MYAFSVDTIICAPMGRCFDLARSVEVHALSAGSTGERIVGGRGSGLLERGEEVTFEGRHLGVRQRLTGRISAFDRPRFFRDCMVRGAFRSLEHDHVFEALSDGETRMTDAVRFAAPLGVLGWAVERAILAGHLRRFVMRRGQVIKAIAESEEWRRFVPAD
jgi:ligand-binding SRPBCC domain-containing protein